MAGCFGKARLTMGSSFAAQFSFSRGPSPHLPIAPLHAGPSRALLSRRHGCRGRSAQLRAQADAAPAYPTEARETHDKCDGPQVAHYDECCV